MATDNPRHHLQELHRRRVGAVVIRPDLREPQSGQYRRPDRRLPAVDERRRRRRRSRPRRAPTSTGGWCRRRCARRSCSRPRRSSSTRKEAFARDMTREMGKVLNETRGDVQEAIDMTFYMAGEGRRMFGQTVPSELRNKFAMSVRQPRRRLLDHHAVELPDGDPVVEDHPGAGLRQHRRLQALLADAALRAELRQRPDRGRRAEGASSTWSPATPRSARR